MNIIKSNEIIKVSNLKILIYGEPGLGKTTIASSAETPLLIDTDNGAHRSKIRADVMRLNNYNEIINDFDNFKLLMKNYKTLIIDTVDTMLNYIGDYNIGKNHRLATNNLQYYGELIKGFEYLIREVSKLNIDILLISHVNEKEDNGIWKKVPAIRGSSSELSVRIADYIGYMYMYNNNRAIDFSPRETTKGKGAHNIGIVSIPNIMHNPQFLSELIAKMKKNFNDSRNYITATKNELNEYVAKINTIENRDELNLFYEDLKDTRIEDLLKKQVWSSLQGKAKNLKCEFDKKLDMFIATK